MREKLHTSNTTNEHTIRSPSTGSLIIKKVKEEQKTFSEEKNDKLFHNVSLLEFKRRKKRREKN